MLSDFPLYFNFAAGEVCVPAEENLAAVMRAINNLDSDGACKLFALIQYDLLLNGEAAVRLSARAQFDLVDFSPFMQSMISRFCEMHASFQRERLESL